MKKFSFSLLAVTGVVLRFHWYKISDGFTPQKPEQPVGNRIKNSHAHTHRSTKHTQRSYGATHTNPELTSSWKHSRTCGRSATHHLFFTEARPKRDSSVQQLGLIKEMFHFFYLIQKNPSNQLFVGCSYCFLKSW